MAPARKPLSGEYAISFLLLATLSVGLWNVYLQLKNDSRPANASLAWMGRFNPGDPVPRSGPPPGAAEVDSITTEQREVKSSNGSHLQVGDGAMMVTADNVLNGSGYGDQQQLIREETGAEDDQEHHDRYKKLVHLVVQGWEENYSVRGNDPEVGDESGDGVDGSMESLGQEEREVVEKLVSSMPPHVTDCEEEDKRRAEFDRRKPDGSLPDWAMDNADHGGPRPPWVQGSNENCLPRTRVVQRDIWVHQHPPNCSDPSLKFVIAMWWPMYGHGIGSQFTGMILLLGAAIDAGRVLVTFPNYERADQKNCVGGDHRHLSCYFAPLTTPECARRAFELKAESSNWTGNESDIPVVTWGSELVVGIFAGAPRRWGVGASSPAAETQPTVVFNGELVVEGDVEWWRAQGLRYLVRWPTKYICGITNRVRNKSFGPMVATEMLGALSRLKNTSLYFEDLKAEMSTRRQWKMHERVTRNGTTLSMIEKSSPFVPRPLMSIHVRLSKSKTGDMKLLGLPSYMKLAEGIRQEEGGVKNVWLSSEVESVIEKSKEYTAWNFFYSKQRRIEIHQTDPFNEIVPGDGRLKRSLPNVDLVEKSFANLFIASEADCFIGALASNWCQLIDELRKTNGRASRKYVTTVNYYH